MPTQRFAITNLLISDMKNSLQVILVIAIMCGSIGGIVVASILKLLDNIVKVCLQMQDLLSWDFRYYILLFNKRIFSSNPIYILGIRGFNGQYINCYSVCSSISRQI